MGYLGATLTQVFTRVLVTQRCHNNPDVKRGLESVNDITHRKRARRILGFWKSQLVELSWDLPREKTVGFRLVAEVRPVAFVAGATRIGGREVKKLE